ncbi:hypothetical protein ACQ4WX_48505 [Streptomyces lasalocidi]
MGIATAALGVTALGAVASQAAAARYESPTAHAASAGSPDSGNAVDGHQLKGSGKAGKDLIDGAIWLGKQIFGVDDEPLSIPRRTASAEESPRAQPIKPTTTTTKVPRIPMEAHPRARTPCTSWTASDQSLTAVDRAR